jgi:phosphoserine phosphatase
MDAVLTLVAAAADPGLPDIADEVAAAVAVPQRPLWLAANLACDLFIEGDAAVIEEAARGAIGGAPVDLVCQPAAMRRKRLLVADLEGTVIENEMLEELAEFLGRRGEVAEITRQAMNGEIDFVAALEARVRLLEGMSQAVLAEATARIRLVPGAAALVATMRAHGAYTVLVSGGFEVFAGPVGARLGFDRVIANRLPVADGRVRGTICPPIVTAIGKAEALFAAALERGIPPALALAVGDGANDTAMLAAAGVGVAFRAKPRVAAAARWRLDHAGLDALLYVQGYGEPEILRPQP